jgi:hypothetical protein
MNNKQTGLEADAPLVDLLAEWIVYVVAGITFVFSLIVAFLAFGLLHFTVQVWASIVKLFFGG